MTREIELKGRVFLTFDIRAVTGLHIGGADARMEIGGVDKTIVRDPLTGRPYIPGSSLKGKLRGLLEKYKGLRQNHRMGAGYIHSCGAESRTPGELQAARREYLDCPVCQAFGVPAERDFSTPTRLVVRDVPLDEAWARKLEQFGHTDLPFTEVKTELAIDRVTAAATSRQMERVPAGALFSRAELVYSIYAKGDCDPLKDILNLKTLVEAMQLLEDDYLGGLGSRGSGKVCLEALRVTLRDGRDYLGAPVELGAFGSTGELSAALPQVQAGIRQALGL